MFRLMKRDDETGTKVAWDSGIQVTVLTNMQQKRMIETSLGRLCDAM